MMWLEVKNIQTKVARATDEEVAWLSSYLSFEDARARFRGGGDQRFRLFNGISSTFPSGLLPLVQRGAAKEGFTIELADRRAVPLLADPNADLAWLRDYQLEAVDTIVAKARGILHIVTGGGKTECFAALTRRLPGKWLFLVHRTTLVDQAADRVELRTGASVGRVGEGRWCSFSDEQRIICASFQTLHARLVEPEAQALLAQADGVCVDECFPATAEVGGRAISEIKVGDFVPSFDTVAQKFCSRRVLKVWVTRARGLVRVHFHGGASFVCTAGHPFLTPRGWVAALGLCGDSVLSNSHGILSQVQPRIFPDTAATIRREKEGVDAGVLDGVPRVCSENRNGTPGNQQAHDGAQPNGDPSKRREDGGGSACARELATEGARRERYGDDGPATGAARLARRGMGSGVGGANRHAATPLQARPGAPYVDDSGGNRRWYPQDQARKGERRQEGPSDGWIRVARVEVLEPRSDEERERLCPGGVVYNLHVDGTETYVVNGVVAHNCHTIPAETFYRIVMMTRGAYWRVGLSGTPLARGDKRSVLAISALGPVVYRIKPERLITAGVLTRPRIRLVPVAQQSDKPTWQGVYGECIVRSKARNRALVEAARRAPKPCLVFVKEIAHGRLLDKAIRSGGLRSEFVWGSDSSTARRGAVKRLVRSDIDVLVCSVVFQEGVDIPELQSVIVGSGGRSAIAALQRIGRGMRVAEGKTEFVVYDIKDIGNKWLERHTRERLRAYTSEGHETIIESTV